VKQALRAIEEYSKLLAPELARQIETIRYEWYTLEKDCDIGSPSRDIAQARLYVLIDGNDGKIVKLVPKR